MEMRVMIVGVVLLSAWLCLWAGLRLLAAYDPSEPVTRARVVPKDTPTTERGWEIYPNGLYEILMRLQKEYGDPMLYVTENGAAFEDNMIKDGKVQDDDRVAFLRDHIAATYRAIRK